MQIKHLVSLCIGSLLLISVSGRAETVRFSAVGNIAFTKKSYV